MKFFIIIALFIINVFGFDIKLNNNIKTINYEYKEGKYITAGNKYFTDSSNLMVYFNKDENELINEFELKYNLILVKELVTGYNIYKTDENILDKIDEIMQDNENLKSIFPAWSKKVEKR